MSYGTHREVGNVEKRQAQYDATVVAGFKGFALGAGAAFAGGAIAQRRFASVRTLPLAIKASLVFSSGVAAGVISADRAGIAFDQAHYDDTAAKADRRLRAFKDDRWAQLSTFDRIMAWAKYHKFKVVIGSWLTSMAGTWLYIQSQPLSFSQKIVQARVWAQGLTLASLLVMAGVTQIPTEADKLLEEEAKKANHSWRDMLQEDNRMEHQYVVLHDNNQREVLEGKDLEDDLVRGLDASKDEAKRFARQIESESSDALRRVREGAHDVYSDAKGAAREAATDAKDKGEDVSNAVSSSAKEATDVGEKLSSSAKEAGEEVKDAAKDAKDSLK